MGIYLCTKVSKGGGVFFREGGKMPPDKVVIDFEGAL